MEWTKSIATEFATGEDKQEETLEEIEERLADKVNCFLE